jgi:hypothetical protein
MTPELGTFPTASFGDETKGDPEGARRTVRRSAPDYQQRLQNEFAEAIRKRELNPEDVWKAKQVEFDDEDDLYRSLQETYDYLSADGTTRPRYGSSCGRRDALPWRRSAIDIEGGRGEG